MKAKAAAWQRQHGALDAPAYRLTLKSRRDALKSFNHGKGKSPEGSERFYSAAEVERLLPWFSRQNARGYDIYITPIDPDHHYLVVDDMHGDALERLKSDGYQPALIQQSSADNKQAIIKAPRDAGGGKAEQSQANELVQELNRRHGDPNFSGVVHPFRLAGFSNKKPRKQNAFTRVIEAAGGLCRRATEALAAIRERRAAAALARERAERVERIEQADPDRSRMPPVEGAGKGYLTAEFQREQRRVLGLVRRQGWSEDWSRIDYRACVNLLREGHPREHVRYALIASSPNLTDRHPHVADYADRTVDNARAEALSEVSEEAARAQRAPRHRDQSGPEGPELG